MKTNLILHPATISDLFFNHDRPHERKWWKDHKVERKFADKTPAERHELLEAAVRQDATEFLEMLFGKDGANFVSGFNPSVDWLTEDYLERM